MTDQPTFSPRTVCRVLDIAAPTLATWAERGYLANFDAALTKPGKARMFTVSDFLALALIKYGSDAEMNFIGLAEIASDAAKGYLHDGVTDLIYADYSPAELRTGFYYVGTKLSGPKPGANATLTITIKLPLIFGPARRALAEALSHDVGQARARLDAVVDETELPIKAISRSRK